MTTSTISPIGAIDETTYRRTERPYRWTVVLDDAALEAALKLARGCYQRDFLRGGENLSGSSLVGKAAHWGARYYLSREAILGRLTRAGIIWSERIYAHGARVLVIGG